MRASFASFVFLLLANEADGKDAINWTFSSLKGDPTPHLDANVGTPGQLVQLKLTKWRDDFEFTVLGKAVGGKYDPTASSTFFLISNDTEAKEVYGKETIMIADGVVETKKNIVVYEKNQTWSSQAGGLLPICRVSADYQRDQLFIYELLKEFDRKEVVLSYDQMCYPGDSAFSSGVLTIGGRPADRCAAAWTSVATVPSEFDQWTFQMDGISFGNHSVTGTWNATLEFGPADIFLPQSVYNELDDALNVWDYLAPCNSSLQLVFNVGSYEIFLAAEEYLDQWNPTKGMCPLLVHPLDPRQTLTLPPSVFKNHCVMFNYANDMVGFAARINQPPSACPTRPPASTPKGSERMTAASWLLSLIALLYTIVHF
ncbi:hypothetical protein M3Y99_00464700 [Aphelenchoides fujianensis]|nr:hypothetical protein M3Y99_00464700 [Aphelenchoides fujianensis]